MEDIDLDVYNRVLRYCLHISNSQVIAEDMVQEAYRKLYDYERRTHNTIHPQALYMWLCKAARNYAIDFYRTKGHGEAFFADRSNGTEESNFENDFSTWIDIHTCGMEGFDIIVENALLMAVFAELNDDERQIMRLLFQGYHIHEVSKKLDKNDSTVRMKVMRMRKKLAWYREELHGCEPVHNPISESSEIRSA